MEKIIEKFQFELFFENTLNSLIECTNSIKFRQKKNKFGSVDSVREIFSAFHDEVKTIWASFLLF